LRIYIYEAFLNNDVISSRIRIINDRIYIYRVTIVFNIQVVSIFKLFIIILPVCSTKSLLYHNNLAALLHYCIIVSREIIAIVFRMDLSLTFNYIFDM